MFSAIVILVGLAAAPPENATVYGYRAQLESVDLTNSDGEALQNLGAILQQDRANYHRFGIRQDFDEYDPFFDDFQTRTQMQALYKPGPRDAEIEDLLAFGVVIQLVIEVCLRDGRPVQISVRYDDAAEGACG